MNWELENLKRDFERLKFDVSRKVEDEDFRRVKHELNECEREISSLKSQVYELERRLLEQQNEIEQMPRYYQAKKIVDEYKDSSRSKGVSLICKDCGDWYGININHKCFKCLGDNFVSASAGN